MGDVDKLLSIMPALSRLNAWCRVEYKQKLDMDSLTPQIYKWKHGAIAAAMRLGIAQLRIVQVPRPCKTCKGTGTYEWVDWNDEDNVDYQPCRRCGATGKVVLRFVESNIAGTKWHTPRPRWDLGYFAEDAWESAAAPTDWEPEQPGAVLERLELIRLVNQVEAVVYEGRSIPRSHSYDGYGLHLGMQPGCWICGSINCRSDYKIWRPIGLRWDSALCEDCWRIEAWMLVDPTWPVTLHHLRERDNYPAWHDRVPLPLLASDPAVLEWLARREIFPGGYPAGDYAFTCSGHFGRVVSATPQDVQFEIDGQHEGLWGGATVRLPHRALRPTGRNPFSIDTMADVSVSRALDPPPLLTIIHVTAGIFGSTAVMR